MKYFTFGICMTIATLVGNVSNAKGTEGHGGNTVFCQGKEPVTLDYYHASRPTGKGPTLLIDLTGQSSDQVVETLAKRIQEKGFVYFAQQFREALQRIGPMDSWIKDDLKQIDDSNEPYDLNAKGCVRKTAAIRQQNMVMYLDPRVADFLSALQLGLLNAHEGFYVIATDAGQDTSESVWNLMRALLMQNATLAQIKDAIVATGGNGNILANIGTPTVKRTLTLLGKNGVGQTPNFTVCEYQARPDGTPILFTLAEDKNCLHGILNKPLSLYPGRYLIMYSNSSRALIEVESDRDLSIDLVPLKGQPSLEKIQYRVFYDYSDRGEFDRIWEISILPDHSGGFYSLLSPGSWGAINIKKFYDTGDVRQITPEYHDLSTNDLGQTCTVYTQGTRSNCHFDWVGELKPNEFISVLPGVYGVQSKYPDGHISYQRGVFIH